MNSNIMKHFLRRIHSAALRISLISLKNVGEEIVVRGWVQNVRKLKKNLFVDINDGSSCNDLQIFISKSILPKEELAISIGDSLEIIGNLSESPQGNKEISAKEINLIGKCNLTDGGYPFTPKQNHPPEYIRNYLHFRSRISYMNSIFRIRHMTTKLIHDYFNDLNFIYVHTPIITENDCEGAGEVFVVNPDNKALLNEMVRKDSKIPLENSFFDKKTYLSVSGQLHLESMSHGLCNTYTLSPTFRAENSRSLIHLSEFYMLEAELGFIENLNELCHFIENMIKTITNLLLDKCDGDLKSLYKKLSIIYQSNDDSSADYEGSKNYKIPNFDWLSNKWEIITYDDAFNILENKLKSQLISSECNYNEGLSKEQELLLVKYFNNTPIFIINWPKKLKPFYMKTLPDDETKVQAVDLLVPDIGELIGGSLRENDLNKLKSNNLPKNLQWYLELRKYGSIPTGGFGMGFERYLQLITSIKNIRDVIPFPRYPHNCRM